MTDLSIFDGYTNCCNWHVYADRGGILYVSECDKEATNIDLRLINSAPALLARVKELEIVLMNCRMYCTNSAEFTEISAKIIDDLLTKEWL